MAGQGSHPLDDVAQELQDWLVNETPYYTEALLGDSRAPFSAPASEDEKLSFYRRKMFAANPDGTPDYTKPNMQGRQELLQRLGIKGYAQVAQATAPPGGFQPLSEPTQVPGQ